MLLYEVKIVMLLSTEFSPLYCYVIPPLLRLYQAFRSGTASKYAVP
jgi:hypothetical protein